LEKATRNSEIKAFLSGKYDFLPALLIIRAGAGGSDAQDWSNVLKRMYQRFAEKKGWQTRVLNQSFGESSPEGEIGIKEVTLEIKGKMAYGLLKRENGVHRLVRLSPFSAKNLRHTSFAMVEVLPQISQRNNQELKIKEEDLRVDTYRASGPGGQYVNKRESAIRITHLPTKISVSCQAERFQGLNRAKAMEMLKSKLIQIKEQEREEKLKKIKGKRVKAEWGSQIRSYILYPYKMVKDHRTGIETSAVEDVLDGELDDFIEAGIKFFKIL
jgi:peptide chain release factor 2